MESYRLTLAVFSLTVFCHTVSGQSTLNAFRQDALTAHNMYRARHGSPKLQLNITLNDVAQKYAERLASLGVLQHSNSPYGENLAWRSGGDWTGQGVTAAWYSEESKYNYDAATFSSGTGHFTQVVWKSTRRVGFGKAYRNGQVYVVAHYDPAGNILGQLRVNVLRPVQQKTSEIAGDFQPTSDEQLLPSPPIEPQPEAPTQGSRENYPGHDQPDVLRPEQQETPVVPVDEPGQNIHVVSHSLQPEEPQRKLSTQSDPKRASRSNGNRLRLF